MGERALAKMSFAIHKSLPYTAKDVQRSIENLEGELPGSTSILYSDGWTILDPEGSEIEDWTRNKDDYRIEYLYFDKEGNTVEEE